MLRKRDWARRLDDGGLSPSLPPLPLFPDSRGLAFSALPKETAVFILSVSQKQNELLYYKYGQAHNTKFGSAVTDDMKWQPSLEASFPFKIFSSGSCYI